MPTSNRNRSRHFVTPALTLALATTLTACGGELALEGDAAELDEIQTHEQAITWHVNNCWPQATCDLDSDGYADTIRGGCVAIPIPTTNPYSCGSGFVMKADDCDDGRATVHPRGRELYGDGLDNNCNGTRDEPTFVYYPLGYINTTSSFYMKVNINDSQVLAYHNSQHFELHYSVEYQALSNTKKPKTTAVAKVPVVNTSSRYAIVSLGGLSANTVYRARIRFHIKLLTSGSTAPIGQWSDWYYTATSGTGSLNVTRTKIVLRGLYEYYLSQHLGMTGYRGVPYPNGLRYGADPDEWWCSEFYSWVVNLHTTIGLRSNVSGIIDYFEGKDAHSSVYLNDVRYSLGRGDYLGVNSEGHSVMVLDYDAGLGKIWIVEGNAGNTTRVSKRSVYENAEWGQLKSNMY